MAPRPDPYSQITNPLNTGWGTTPQAPTTPPAVPIVQQVPPTGARRRRSPWLRRGVVLVVLALVAGLVWWQRERIGDTIDDLRGETTSQAVGAPSPRPPGGTPTTPTSPLPVDETDAYLAWERANYDELEPLLVDWRAIITRNVTTPEEAITYAVQMRDQTQLLANLVDTAPASQIRSDILSLLINLMSALERLERSVRERDPAAAATAEATLEALTADLERFQATHGTESVFLR